MSSPLYPPYGGTPRKSRPRVPDPVSSNVCAIVRTLTQIPLFQALSPAALHALAQEVQVQSYQRAVLLRLEPHRVYVMAAGRVHLHRLDRIGRRLTLRFVDAGESFTLPAGDHAQACTPVTCLYAIPLATLQELHATQPAFAWATVQLLQQRLADAYARMEDLALGPIATRLARLLVRLAQAHPEQRVLLSHQELADRLGTRPEQITKMLRVFRRQDWVVTQPAQPGLVVRDPATLLTLAEAAGTPPPPAAPAGRPPASPRPGAALPAGPA